MKKNQTDRLSKQHIQSKGAKGIFSDLAQQHDNSVKSLSKLALKSLKNEFQFLEFRYRAKISKNEINAKLNNIDKRLGVTIFVNKASIKPDGGIMEESWRNHRS